MIQAIFFDIGNVILRLDFSNALRSIAAKSPLGVDAIRSVIQGLQPAFETGRTSTAEFLEQAAAATSYSGGAQEFATAYCNMFALHDPMAALVRTLRGKLPIYLFSNTSDLHQSDVFERFPVFSAFDGGIFSWQIGAMKPEDAFYQAGLALAGIPPAQIFYIDDAPANIEAGRRFGLQTHLYDLNNHEALVAALRNEGIDVS
jgi:putative hydrolase of the HAD superfamily